jgi:hypothetical protein
VQHAENTADILKKYNAKLRKPQIISINDGMSRGQGRP